MKTTGFASPATDYEQERLDFNRYLIPFPSSEFEFRYQGHDMEEYHIQNGDILIINRALNPFDGCLAIIVFEDKFLCRKILYSKKWGCFVFFQDSKWHRVTEIFGVATFSIHNWKNGVPDPAIK